MLGVIFLHANICLTTRKYNRAEVSQAKRVCRCPCANIDTYTFQFEEKIRLPEFTKAALFRLHFKIVRLRLRNNQSACMNLLGAQYLEYYCKKNTGCSCPSQQSEVNWCWSQTTAKILVRNPILAVICLQPTITKPWEENNVDTWGSHKESSTPNETHERNIG